MALLFVLSEGTLHWIIAYWPNDFGRIREYIVSLFCLRPQSLGTYQLPQPLLSSPKGFLLLTESESDDVLTRLGIAEKAASRDCRHADVFHQKFREFHVVRITPVTDVAHDVVRAFRKHRVQPSAFE